MRDADNPKEKHVTDEEMREARALCETHPVTVGDYKNFIAAARTLVPRLIDRVLELQRENEELRSKR